MRTLFRCLVMMIALLTLVWQVVPTNGAPAAQQGEPAAAYTIYIPGLRTPGTPPDPVDPVDPVDPGPGDESGALFMEPGKKTIGSSVAVDAQGGLHMTYHYRVPQNENPDGIYAYCPPPASQCGNANAWQLVNLGGPIDDIQLQLNSAGQPRILATSSPAEANGDKQYWYAECNSNCGSGEQWGVVYVTSSYTGGVSTVTGVRYAKRSFALDPQGRPRFVFYNANYRVEPDLYGGYYYSCDADCTVQGNWTGSRFTHQRQRTEYSFDYEKVDEPALTFTSTGQPRVVALLYPYDNADGTDFQVYYFACDGDCTDDANWDRARVSPRGGGPYPAWDLELDANDRPRVVVYRESLGDGSGKQLYYYQCDANCLSDGSWQPVNLGLGSGTGLGADLALDGQGRPRTTYVTSAGDIGYSWCDTQCGQAGNWQHAIAETNAQLTAAYPVARPLTCDAGLWDSYAPSLVIDSQGNPRIAYTSGYSARCANEVEPGEQPTVTFREVWHTVRLIYTTQP
jgi:hypothetical protein